jgi:hypothetical protein
MITHGKLKALVRRNQLDELYQATVEVAKDVSSKPFLEWVQSKYSDIFLEGLPPSLPLSWNIEHEIPLKDSQLVLPF